MFCRFQNRIYQKGFSLIELMVVVSVIGLLAAIGVPQYHKFRVKAFQTEAKSHLSAIYTAEVSFFTEYSGYHNSLKVLGYSPVGKNRYMAGFDSTVTLPPDAPVETTILTTYDICAGPYGGGTDTDCQIVMQVPTTPLVGSTWADTISFSAVAIAREDSLNLAANELPQNSSVATLALQLLTSFDSANAASRVGIPGGATQYFENWSINQNKVMSQSRLSSTGL